MIPAHIAEQASTETVRLEFQEPLTRDDRLLIDLLAERYAGKDGTPFMSFSRDGVTTLICPKAIRRILPYADTFTVEAPSAVRLPNGAGASNG